MTQGTLQTISPVDGSVVVERSLSTPEQLSELIDRGHKAHREWKRRPLEERVALLHGLVDRFVSKTDVLAHEITLQMGRPISQSPGEIAGFAERARAMLDCAPKALATVRPEPKAGFDRWIQREPLGLVLVLAPWNYPYLTAVNSIVPALAAGNTVLLKHSDQTPLCAERMVEAALEAGIPEGVFQFIHMTHDLTAKAVQDPRVGHVAFTGSVAGGKAVHQAAAGRFIDIGLELGGKDPAYVAADADIATATESLVDGAYFNSGQSCCGIERIYVASNLFSDFVDRFVTLTNEYRLGNPTDESTNLGPVVRVHNASVIQRQIDQALRLGAQTLIRPADFAGTALGANYLAPQVMVNVNHTMDLMSEETFGPVVGIMPVDNEADAIEKMNDCRYGLTASVWTQDVDRAHRVAQALNTGTVFMNRCDYLDPALAWTGIGDSGRGCTLSTIGYESLTRPKSFHFRIPKL